MIQSTPPARLVVDFARLRRRRKRLRQRRSDVSTEAILSAIIGLLILVIGALAKVMFDHAKDCRDFRVRIAQDQGMVHEKLDRIKSDIGDGDTGLRGSLHKLRNDISPFILWARAEQEKRRK